ncbi:hypothetical protein EVAR_69612_1 [Eumeta japonica]|uniref:Uncharacterized protein n=1 Tax=Eumeta variegata TaxID=151549 RepID=A0A4C2A7V4_EUMVA|nr:hypothetical protein EVAR_69612_1 [Eumeta japonica]
MKTSFVLLCLLCVACCASSADRHQPHGFLRPHDTGNGEAGPKNLSTCSGKNEGCSYEYPLTSSGGYIIANTCIRCITLRSLKSSLAMSYELIYRSCPTFPKMASTLFVTGRPERVLIAIAVVLSMSILVPSPGPVRPALDFNAALDTDPGPPLDTNATQSDNVVLGSLIRSPSVIIKGRALELLQVIYDASNCQIEMRVL